MTQLSVRGRDGVETITSSCEYHYENMSYKSAKKSSKNAPCTNVPIHCSLCPPSVSREPQTIWKYNAINHLLISHSDEDPTQAGKYKAPIIPGDLMMDMFVTRQEEKWMKINPSATTTFRREHDIPSSDGLESYVMQDEERQKRDRSNTLTVPEPAENLKRRKKN